MITLYRIGPKGSGKTFDLHSLLGFSMPTGPLSPFALSNYQDQEFITVDEPRWTDKDFRTLFVTNEGLLQIMSKGRPARLTSLPRFLVISKNPLGLTHL